MPETSNVRRPVLAKTATLLGEPSPQSIDAGEVAGRGAGVGVGEAADAVRRASATPVLTGLEHVGAGGQRRRRR